MESAAVKSEGLVIPLIDFSSFLHGDADKRRESGRAILDGFRTAGFIYLKGLPVSADTLKHVFDTSAKYFRLPIETKMTHCWTTAESNRGYSAPGREKTTQLTDPDEVQKLRHAVPDLKESLEIGREDEPGHPNHWPEESGELAGFRQTMLDFHHRCKELHMHLMRAIAVGMDLDDHHFFDPYCDRGDNTLRLLHYPQVRKDVFTLNPAQVRAGAHTDYGSITLLFQDSRGGLQVRSPSGVFVDAAPIADTVVVNAGDMLARWSNDTIKSTVHRVVEPPSADADVCPARYSIAYFCNPNFDRCIDAIPGTFSDDEDKKYPPINSGQYLVQRLAATY